MSMPINLESYLTLIKGDVEWLLKNTERDLERDHIIAIIKESIKFHYPKETPDEEFIKWWEDIIGVWDWKKYEIKPTDPYIPHEVIKGKPCSVCSHMHCLSNNMQCPC